MMLLLIAALSLPTHTPGKVRPLTTQQVCSIAWGKDRRHVTHAMKLVVAQRYHVAEADWSKYEFDHLIPRELGGADDVENLWPQPLPEAHVKDHIENLLHRQVCSGEITLKDAQRRVIHWSK